MLFLQQVMQLVNAINNKALTTPLPAVKIFFVQVVISQYKKI